MPKPRTSSAAISHHSFVARVRQREGDGGQPHDDEPADRHRCARRSSRSACPARVRLSRAPTPCGMSSSAAVSASVPRTIWKYSGSSSIAPYSDAPDRNSTADDDATDGGAAAPRPPARSPGGAAARARTRSRAGCRRRPAAQTSVRREAAVLADVRQAVQDADERGRDQQQAHQSSRACRAADPRAGTATPAPDPTMQNGTLTQNSQRQSSQLRMIPPMVGPRIGPSAAGRLTIAIRRPRPAPPGHLLDGEGRHQRHHEAAADALQHPEGDQARGVPRQAAGDRGRPGRS